MPTVLLLIAAGVVLRLLGSPMVFQVPYVVAPLGALSLYAAARLPRTWAFVVPVAILALSDVVIDLNHGYPFWGLTRLTTYGMFVLIVALGRFAPQRAGLPQRAVMAMGARTLFFLTSNFVVWMTGGGYARPHTLSGLMSTYVDGLPFYGVELAAEVVGVVVLFGLVDALRARATVGEPAAAESLHS